VFWRLRWCSALRLLSSAEWKAVLVAVGRDALADLLLTHVLLIRQDSAFVQVSARCSLADLTLLLVRGS
jgi:hypothetical protein